MRAPYVRATSARCGRPLDFKPRVPRHGQRPGEVDAHYEKIELVPSRTFGAPVSATSSSDRRGFGDLFPQGIALLTSKARSSSMICYRESFPNLTAARVNEGADARDITNELDRGSAPYQGSDAAMRRSDQGPDGAGRHVSARLIRPSRTNQNRKRRCSKGTVIVDVRGVPCGRLYTWSAILFREICLVLTLLDSYACDGRSPRPSKSKRLITADSSHGPTH